MEQPLEESLVYVPVNTQHRDAAPFETDKESSSQSVIRNYNLSQIVEEFPPGSPSAEQ